MRGTPGAWRRPVLQAVASCTYLKLLDTGARIIGEALSVRNLDVLTIQNPGQVVPHLSAERKQRVDMLLAIERVGAESIQGKRRKWVRRLSPPTWERSGFYLHYINQSAPEWGLRDSPDPSCTSHTGFRRPDGSGLLKLIRNFLEESR